MAIPDGLEFQWELHEGAGSILQTDGPHCRVTSQQAGALTVQVTAVQNDIQPIAECTVKFLENLSEDDRDSSKGLPSYRLEADRGEWEPEVDR